MTHAHTSLQTHRQCFPQVSARAPLIDSGIIHRNNTPQAYLTASCHDAQTGGFIFLCR